jgi:hypothetical protein
MHSSVTIVEGRPLAGMPTCKARFDDRQREELPTFVPMIQR